MAGKEKTETEPHRLQANTSIVLPLEIEVEGEGRILTLSPGQATVFGRTGGADIVLADFSVGRRHARITDETGVWTVEDTDSPCGTRVNGLFIGQQRVQIFPGDRIRLGVVELLVRGSVGSPEAGRPSRPWEPPLPRGLLASFRIRDDAIWSAPAEGVDTLLDTFHHPPLLDYLREARHGGTADLRCLDRDSFLLLIATIEHECLSQICGHGVVRGDDREVMLARMIDLLTMLRCDPRAKDRPPLKLHSWETAGLARELRQPGRDAAWRAEFLAADPAWTEQVLYQVLEGVPGSE